MKIGHNRQRPGAWLAGLACACLMFEAFGAVAGVRLLVVTEQSVIHDRVVAELRQAIKARTLPVTLAVHTTQQISPDLLGQCKPDATLVVTLGSSSARTVHALGAPPPHLHALLSSTDYRALAGHGTTPPRPGESALFLDHPPARQLQALALALPHLTRIGVLTSDSESDDVAALSKAAEASGRVLVVQEVSEPRFLITRLDQLLHDADLLLVTPDVSLYNRYSLQKVLLAAYRQRKPVIGLSEAYVTAGSLLALHSTAETIAEDLADRVDDYLATGQLAATGYPKRFRLSVNRQVARSLGLDVTLGAPAELEQRLRKAETRR